MWRRYAVCSVLKYLEISQIQILTENCYILRKPYAEWMKELDRNNDDRDTMYYPKDAIENYFDFEQPPFGEVLDDICAFLRGNITDLEIVPQIIIDQSVSKKRRKRRGHSTHSKSKRKTQSKRVLCLFIYTFPCTFCSLF